MTHRRLRARPARYDRQVALVLQGGGALGSYQAGVYEVLASSEYLPDWVAGISIGAINAAIIAGNAPADRVARLRSFWEQITAPTAAWPTGLRGPLSEWQQGMGALSAVMFGQPGFFAPRAMQDWVSSQKPNSIYNIDALKGTLERLVDFDRINDSKQMRFSVGAVNVRTGRFAYFDSEEITIRPEHVMASGALPPGFPPVEIDGEQYWDGGLVSNSPLQYVLDHYPRRSRLTFQVDLFQGYGRLPANLEESRERAKDIRYASRTRVNTDAFRQMHEVRHAIDELHRLLPENIAKTDAAQRLLAFGCATQMDIVQLIYRPFKPQGASKAFEFSRGTMTARWEQGVSDALATLRAAPWLAPADRESGVRTFDVMHDILVAKDATTRYARPVDGAATPSQPAEPESAGR